jgi:hypothetical protein
MKPDVVHHSAESLLLAAIHTWAVSGAPRLRRVAPRYGNEGDPLLLEGDGFADAELEVDFAGAATWAVALSGKTALTLVPAGARPGPVTVVRQGLRSNSVCFGGPDDEGPSRVLRVEPGDGATGVFRDTPVVARLSHPGQPESVTCETFRVLDDEGAVPAKLRLSPDGLVVIWLAQRLLAPGVNHFVVSSGLEDVRGQQVLPHLSRFLPCHLAREDLPL